MRVHVVIESKGVDARRTPEFAKPEVTLGRRPSNDVVLPDAGASGSHARVFVTGSALTIVDLESTNGTFVNRKRLQGPHVLATEDVVEIGDTKLRFSLSGVESTSIESIPPPPMDGAMMDVPSPVPVSPTVAQVSAAPPAGDEADWPAPPPLMDELSVAPGPPAPASLAVTDPRASTPAAVFPRLAKAAPATSAPPPRSPPPAPARRPPSAPAPGDNTGFEFFDAPPEVLVDRVFAAVWRRISRQVLGAEAGIAARASSALQAALIAANAVRPLGDVQALHRRMLAEMVEDGPIPGLLEGQPDEVVFVSAYRARISRRGHVSEGEGPFTCPAALEAWVRRVTGTALNPSSAVARGLFGEYAVHGAYAPAGSVVSLRRRTTQGTANAETLTQAGVLSAGMLALLSACVASRLSVMVCTGPGARATQLMAAMMAGGATHELQVALVSPGADLASFPRSAVVLTRSGRAGDSLDSALGLGPDRLAVEEMHWNEAGAVAAAVARSFSQILGVRAPSAALGLTQLQSMLSESMHATTAVPMVMRSVDLAVSLHRFSDGVDRVTQVAEPLVDEAGRLTARDIFTLVPGSRTWQFSGVRPQCFEDIVHRGFPLDPAIFV